MKILLADDDRTTRLMLTRVLESWGYDVTAVDNGADAWALIREGGYRLVLSDWEMPEVDGKGLCALLRSWSGPYVYVILLTSHTSTSHMVEGLDAGADDYVAKPFEPAVLRARLSVGQRLLGLQDELAQKNVALASANSELARANSELARIATTDPLLDIGNRRSFEDLIVHAHSHARRSGRAYGVIIADIDHFKRFNDRCGHTFGDTVLKRVASSLNETLTGKGSLFRYGGEELIAVAQNQTREGLMALAEAMRAAVAAIPIAMPLGETSRVTVSLGVALFDPSDAISCQVVIDYADASLYYAKKLGRNRVVAWPFDDARPPRTSQF